MALIPLRNSTSHSLNCIKSESEPNCDPSQGRSISLITRVNPLPGWGPAWTRKMTPSIPIFRNEINALGNFREGVNIASEFTIQAAMGWRDCHLHAFDIGGEQFGDRRSVDDVVDENRPTLNGLLRSSVVRFAYTYDFGDNWEHTIAFEKSEPAVEGQSYPVCIAGKRNCPPEDCGGVWGYEELLAILADPAHPEHAEQIDWTGEEFKPDEFDLERANTVLAARFRKK